MGPSETVTKLRASRVAARDYRYTPRGVLPEQFIASIENDGGKGKVLIHEGTESEIKVVGDRRFRQALVTVTEQGREMREQYRSIRIWDKDKNTPSRSQLRAAFTTAVPVGTRYTTEGGRVRTEYSHNAASYPVVLRFWEGTIVATIPESTQRFLMGMDETHHFISAVDGEPKTVAQAWRALRPKGISRRAVRQGEWFFDPVSPDVSELLNELTKPYRGKSGILKNEELEFGSTHQASELTSLRLPGERYHERMRFARGKVTDRRKGRHAALVLPDWHSVHRNTEQRVDPRQPRMARWD